MAVELATAYVSLSVSGKGLRGDVDKALGGVVDESGKKQGSKLGGLLWGGVKKAGVATAAGIGAATGAALYKGFGRLSAIEDAEAKLRGLGHSGETVAGIMDNALASVKGTAFGLDEAATTAAGAVAAGIKPGKELERTLKLTGDTATIAGSSMGEMGSIFNKVAASNRLSMAEVNQLSDRGVPIMQMLADQYGVTAEEARKMVSSGEVDFANFQEAIEENIAGAALESGNTTSGAFKNMGAALGRVGAQLLGGIFPQLKGGFGGVTEMLDGLGPIAEKAGAALGNAIQWAADKVGNFVTEFKNGEGAGGRFRDIMTQVKDALMTAFDYVRDTVIPALSNMWGWIKDNKDTLLLLASAVLGGYAAFKTFMFINTVITAVKTARVAFMALNATMRANPIGVVVTAIGALVGALVWLYHNNETAREIMQKAWSAIKGAISAVVNWFKDTAWPWMRDALQWIGDKATWLWDKAIKPAFNGVKSVVSSVVSWIKDTAWPWARDAFQNVGDKATWLWEKVVTPAFNGIKSVISGAWDGAKSIFDKFKSGLNSLRDRFRSVRDGIVNIWGSVARAVGRPVNGVITFFNKFLSGLESTINKIPGVDISLPRISEIPLPAVYVAGGGRGGGGGSPVTAATGGLIPGFSPHDRADNIPAMLTAGEYVLPVGATRSLMSRFGGGFLEQLRRGLPGFASGGYVGASSSTTGKAQTDEIGLGSLLMSFLKNPVGAIKDIVNNLLSGIGDSWPAQVALGAAGSMVSGFTDWIKEKIGFGSERGDFGRGSTTPMMWPTIWNLISNLIPGARMTSNFRPGAITASGYRSFHGLGRAVDFVSPNMGAAWDILRTLPLSWSELYFSPRGFVRRGRTVPRSQVAGSTIANHYDHVHAAMADGGMVKPLLFDQGGYLPRGLSLVSNQTGKPEPLTRTDKGGPDGPVFHIVNYYPVAEPASKTVQRARDLASNRGRW